LVEAPAVDRTAALALALPAAVAGSALSGLVEQMWAALRDVGPPGRPDRQVGAPARQAGCAVTLA
jgi:hypothetical protein